MRYIEEGIMEKNIYRQLIELSPMAYGCIKIFRNEEQEVETLKIIDTNKSFETFFGIKKSSLQNYDFKERMNPLKYEILLKKLKEADHKGQTTFRYENAKKCFMNVEVYKLEKDEYHIRFTKMSKQDKNIFKMLKQSPFPMWVKNLEDTYIEVNDTYLETFNVKYEDIIGSKTQDVWGLDYAEQFERGDVKVKKVNNICKEKNYLKIEQFGNRYFEIVRWPYTDEESEMVLGIMGIAIEITDKIKVKESIEKNENLFLDMANNLDEVIILRDEKKALYISPYFEQLYQFKPDKLYEDIDYWYEYWDYIEYVTEPASYHVKEIDTCTFRVVKEGKIDKWIQSKFIPIFDENGNVVRKVGILRDITDKKKLDEEIEQLRLEFFANVSHELRTPIHVIMSALEMMQLQLKEKDEAITDQMSKYTQIISQNGCRLIRLVNNLIDTTKINSGNFDYRPTNQDIVSFIEDICTSVTEFIKGNGLTIIFDTDVEERMVAFDMEQMERIILNLLSNAIKFNKEHGNIEVEIETKKGITITVKDTGIGIPEDRLSRIFKRFEQVDRGLRREKEGSGIGLALVKSFVEMHGGTITLKSTLGEGSTFRITLPDVLVEEQDEKIVKSVNDREANHKVKIAFSDIYCE